ncbi:MAG: hypothetical protein KA099_05625 [Alphaproteobacteria bacterium]|nr:hypothetical protein [Alphaproteobacteria bacterium]MBP7757657.1 hypothetical protein [Alphaproteobacteria bacterium]MBP7761143.1 hypothetical protein [Alphaproteobacteria bacterium]MBP7904790.1 hypothetical protein [Alphaproteobacteria bacterium]
MTRTVKTLATLILLLLPTATLAQDWSNIDNRAASTTVTETRIVPQVGISHAASGSEKNAGNVISFNMAPLQVELTAEQQDFLSRYVLAPLNANPNLRLAIQSLARTNPDDRYESTRIAIARGLEVRQFFMDHKILSKRLVSQPLGIGEKPADDDRIDLLLFE